MIMLLFIFIIKLQSNVIHYISVPYRLTVTGSLTVNDGNMALASKQGLN